MQKRPTKPTRNQFQTRKWKTNKAGDKLYSSLEDLERHKSSVTKASETLRNQEERLQEISKLKSEIKDEERKLVEEQKKGESWIKTYPISSFTGQENTFEFQQNNQICE